MKNESLQEIKDTLDLAIKYGEKTRIRLQGNILFMLFDLYKDDAQIKAKVASIFEKEESVYADVVSSQENPNCSCRGRFTAFITNNFDKCLGYFEELFNSELIDDAKVANMTSKAKEMWDSFILNEKTRIHNELNAIAPEVAINSGLDISNNSEISNDAHVDSIASIRGKVFTITNSENGYMNFVSNLNSSSYKGFSVVEQGNSLKIYVY